MKKFIAAAGIGAALAIVPLAVAGAANASTGSFLNVLKRARLDGRQLSWQLAG